MHACNEREMRKRGRIRHNTRIRGERREKEIGYNTLHTYKKREEKKKKDKTQYTHTKREKRKRRRKKIHTYKRKKRKGRRGKYNTRIQIERREKEEG